ncbi:probable LRR receptor-like serine/threonine-protein kinase At3g47570 [Hibiscus syriacus]|uniref:probable LRR receptor-like serine/threonine-protein kinase At3g47570 n=1 Tax=Hibiscus syriacus TaxID=106335 RepID=UPI0019244985|nr:probable LRR receptor-like serine/threonine-protein kinase At3g47570 [Hibiscus syriacus]
MRSNQLTGEMPAFLGFLTNLKFLRFRNNSLRGTIPPSLGNLSSLEVLDLAANGLTGILPEALGRLTNLSYFTVATNAISGNVPVSMFNLSNIRFFSVGGNNNIHGTLPSNLAITMPYIEFFSVAENQLSGQIPISVSNASNLNVLELDGNRLNGNVPSLEKLDKLRILTVFTNQLGHGREGDLNFLCTLVNDTKLESLDISINNFGGVFPKCISNFSSAVLQLVMEDNKMWGRIPDGIENLINLESLRVSENHLSGHIPFNIELNTLQGSIPSSLGKCQNLLVMDLSDNNLSGTIPPQVLGLSSMSIALDLSSNYLTGELPLEIENLEKLGELDVSRNRLSGFLPNNLGSCVGLEKLLLDGNSFEGPIPSSFSSLRGLVRLDMSDNNLSGVFKNASATFVEGNNKLCGGIPELHLSRCNSKTSSNTSLKIAIVVVVFGVTLVFTSLLVLWFRKKKEQPTTTCVENSLLQLSYQMILKATDGFSMQNFLGSGSFGSVYKGILEESGETIAIKVLNLLNQRASRSFMVECALKNIRHRNLVKVLTAISGVDYQGNDFKALVYEFMENGSLENWLHPSTAINEPEMMRNLNFFQRVNVAIDVAHALEYLHHHCETPIIHCGLKPSNILLDEAMVGHLSDFGLEKFLAEDLLNYSTNQSSSLGLRGTIGYAPPGQFSLSISSSHRLNTLA